MAKKTFTLHLAKADIQDVEQLLSEGALERLTTPMTVVSDVPDFCEKGRVYIFSGLPKEPPWFKDMRLAFGLTNVVTTSSSCALIFFEKSSRIFAISFAHGWMYLNDDNFEGDFGLRVAINAVDESKLKRLERANLGDSLRGVSLSPFQRDFKSFGIDDALDLVRKISGEAKADATADSFTGSRALKFSGDCAIDDLPEIADECLQYYSSEQYKETTFGIIDVVCPIGDPRLIEDLDLRLVESVKTNGEEFELGLPEAYGEQSVAYKFRGCKI